jgi:hypothetical protein
LVVVKTDQRSSKGLNEKYLNGGCVLFVGVFEGVVEK